MLLKSCQTAVTSQLMLSGEASGEGEDINELTRAVQLPFRTTLHPTRRPERQPHLQPQHILSESRQSVLNRRVEMGIRD